MYHLPFWRLPTPHACITSCLAHIQTPTLEDCKLVVALMFLYSSAAKVMHVLIY
jgi:hypothetical protein